MMMTMLTRRKVLSACGLVALISFFLFRCAARAAEQRVILITIDGLAAGSLARADAPAPVLRKLARNGASAESLRVSNPTCTWPNHTTLITGVQAEKHSVLFNGMLVRRGPGEPVTVEVDRDQADLIAVPTLFDQLHRAGYRTAAINWPCTRGSTTLDDHFPDAPDRIAGTTPRFRAELVRAGILEDVQDSSFSRKGPAAADQAWCAAAIHLLQTRPPRLLLLHLLATDAIQHRYGPGSPAADTALALADAQVGLLIEALEKAGLAKETTVFVVSDHGFARPTKLIYPNVVLRKAGLLRPAPRRRAQCVSEGGTAFVYLTNPASAKDDRLRVVELLRGLEGIQQILEPSQYAPLHLPDPGKNPQMGDLLLVATPGCVFGDESMEDQVIVPLPTALGSHGYLASDPRMNGIFVAWGRRIRPGVRIGMVDNIDVAPTIAALFGQTLGQADGRVLREILQE